ncbi:MAG: gliding motility-associated C-terminal domain-containing protein [Bacteroidetes bacterium]|nr:gliding motility-associated C-terminal domain-containing protein [Bacteroidota bacterium]
MKSKNFNSIARVFLFAALFVTKISFCQNTINAGPDDTICPPASATLTATVSTTSGLNGTALTLSDDWYSNAIPLGFNFTFFGNTYNQIVVGSNNMVTFDLANANQYDPWSISAAIPTNSAPINNSIMCPWEDLLPPAGGTEVYTTTGTAPNRIFIVSYCSTPMFSCTNILYTGSIMLYETSNIIETHIANKYSCAWNGSYAIHGIQNATGTIAYVVPGRNFPSIWTTANEGYQFVPTGPTTYSQGFIPYAPIILNSPTGAIQWYQGSTLIGTGPSITVSPTTTTQYVALIGGCAGVQSDTVNVVVLNLSVNAGVDDTICPGSPVQLNGTSPDPITGWSWLPTLGLNNPNIANPIASPTVTTTYTLTGTNGICSVTDIVTIVVNNSSLTCTTAQTNPMCFSNCNGSATVTVTSSNGPFTYLWLPSGGTGASATGLCAGTYSCTITAPLGCSLTQSFTITQPPVLAFTMNTVPADCDAPNGTATATPTGGTTPYTYLWSNGQTTQTATNLAMGTYGVTVTDANGCTQIQSISVFQATPPVATVTATPPGFVLGGSSQLVAGTGNSYQWSPATGLSCTNCANPIATPQQTTTYCVVVSDTTIGCSDSTCITINVEIPCISGGLDKLMPNAFSPNNDGVNDEFCIPPNVCIQTFELKIFDRWGEKVFETTNMTKCWDGTYKGEMLNKGLFVYYFDAVLTTGDEYHRQGNISLIR